MAIAPITGMLKRQIIADVSIGFTLGITFASYWWWGFHKPQVARREEWYAKNGTGSVGPLSGGAADEDDE